MVDHVPVLGGGEISLFLCAREIGLGSYFLFFLFFFLDGAGVVLAYQ